jgi:hypothetical protein
MGKTTSEFCRICDYNEPKRISCKQMGYREQLYCVSRGWCPHGRIEFVEMKFIHRNYVQTRDRRYARRSSEQDDIILKEALIAGGKKLEKFEVAISVNW